MADPITVIDDVILEKTTPEIVATIKDENDEGIPAASLNTLTLTLYNLDDGPVHAIINSRNAQDVLNANGVTVDTAGILTWSVNALDTAIVGTGVQEKHRAVFEWTYNGGVKNGKHVIDMFITNLAKIT